MKNITIEELAKRLNVSKSTISRAFRDSFDISEKTKKRILDEADKLGFQPNATAQSLREKRTRRVGVVIPSFTIPFYATAICGMQEIAREENYNLMICQSDESYKGELENIRSLMKSQVDGIILSVSKETSDFSHLTKLKKMGVPLVLFNRATDLPDISKVRVDDYDATYSMTEYLISKGYKNIVYIAGPKNLLMTSNRIKGYRDAMYVKKQTISTESIVYGDFSIQSGRESAEMILNTTQPDAIFCSCDNVAFGVMQYIKEKGLRIPEDIAVAGYTDELFASLIEPRLTTVRQPIEEIGRMSARLLFKQLKYKNVKPEICICPTEIIVRQST